MNAASIYQDNKPLIQRSLLAVLLGFLVIPYPLFMYPETGLDYSWALSFALASKYNLEFGTDLIFTYGPLGYLPMGLPDFQNYYSIILFRLFIVVNGIGFVYYLFTYLRNAVQKTLVVLCLVFLNFLFCGYTDILLYFYFLFHVFLYQKSKSFLSMLAFTTIACGSLYIKVNVGVIINLLYIITLFYFLIDKIAARMHLLFAVLIFIALHVLLATSLRVSLVPYLLSSLDVINYYNDAMAHLPNPGVLSIAVFLVLIFVGLTLYRFREIINKRSEIFLFFNVALFLYVVFKYGFVRGDSGHYPAFFMVAPYLLFLIFMFSTRILLRPILLKLVPVMIVLISMVKVNPGHFANDFINIAKNIFFYKAHRQKSDEEQLAKVKLPQRMLDSIGNKPVDILPSEISIAFYNGLTYNPRPIIQSYSAYSANLTLRNYEKYMSATAPEFIIYHTGDLIDNRFAIWDDQYCYLALLQRYHMVDTGSIRDKHLILFKKGKSTKKITRNLVLDTLIELNKPFAIPQSDKLLFIESDLEYSTPGKIKRLLFQPTSVKIQLTDESYMTSNFKVIVPLLKSGLLINKALRHDASNRFVDFDAIQSFFSTSGIGGKRNISLKFTAPSFWTQGKFRARFWEYSIEPENTLNN